VSGPRVIGAGLAAMSLAQALPARAQSAPASQARTFGSISVEAPASAAVTVDILQQVALLVVTTGIGDVASISAPSGAVPLESGDGPVPAGVSVSLGDGGATAASDGPVMILVQYN
jgi:hypothetical protein